MENKIPPAEFVSSSMTLAKIVNWIHSILTLKFLTNCDLSLSKQEDILEEFEIKLNILIVLSKKNRN
jgi:hypothetical protein